MAIPKDILKLLESAPIQIEGLADKMTESDRGEAARKLCDLAQSAAWLSGYFFGRYGEGCGDQGHTQSIKDANKRRAGVRKSFGFTFPEAGTIRI